MALTRIKFTRAQWGMQIMRKTLALCLLGFDTNKVYTGPMGHTNPWLTYLSRWPSYAANVLRNESHTNKYFLV